MAIPFTPRWQGPIEGRAVNLTKRWFPSLCAEYEFDDLLQDAYIVYMRCKEKYPTVDNKAWFMSIFSLSWERKLMNLAVKTGRYISLEELEEGGFTEPAVAGNEGFLRCILHEIPQELLGLVKQVIYGAEAESRKALKEVIKRLPATEVS